MMNRKIIVRSTNLWENSFKLQASLETVPGKEKKNYLFFFFFISCEALCGTFVMYADEGVQNKFD